MSLLKHIAALVLLMLCLSPGPAAGQRRYVLKGATLINGVFDRPLQHRPRQDRASPGTDLSPEHPHGQQKLQGARDLRSNQIHGRCLCQGRPPGQQTRRRSDGREALAKRPKRGVDPGCLGAPFRNGLTQCGRHVRGRRKRSGLIVLDTLDEARYLSQSDLNGRRQPSGASDDLETSGPAPDEQWLKNPVSPDGLDEGGQRPRLPIPLEGVYGANIQEPDRRTEEGRIELFDVVGIGPHTVSGGEALPNGHGRRIVAKMEIVQSRIHIRHRLGARKSRGYG